MGRKAQAGAISRAVPLIRVKSRDLAAAGIVRVPRVVGVRDGSPLLADGRVLQVNNVIWCSGYEAGFEWMDLPIFERGRRGIEAGWSMRSRDCTSSACRSCTPCLRR